MYIIMGITISLLAAALVVCVVFASNANTRVKKLSKICAIGEKIASNIKIKNLMKEIMEVAQKELNAETGSLYLVDEEHQELWFEIVLGEKGELIKEIRLKIGEGVAGWVAKEGVTLNLKDVNQDPRFRRDISKKIDHKQKAMLTMPVRSKGKIVGVLQLINKTTGGHFTKQDEELFAGISSQTAIAIENAMLYQNMKDLFVESIRSLAGAIDAKDPYTNGHSLRVTQYSMGVGREMGMSDEQLENLEYMAVLHDVGKIGIKDMILNKQAALDDEEFAIMKTHTVIGAKILSSMKSLNRLIAGAKYHHEKFNGTGYSEGLKGSEIPVEARIIAVSDTYDAMTTDRPYRKGLEHSIAMAEINRFSGTQFDPDIVKHFNSVMERKLVVKNGA